MFWFHKPKPDEPKQVKNHQLQEIIEQNSVIIRLLCLLVREEAPPQLKHIRIAFLKGLSMATPGPVTLTSLGQQVTASVVGFDQFGQPFTGTIPTPTLTSDDSAGAIVTFDPSTGLTTAVTVAIPVVPPPTPVLSSIKVAFA